MAPALVTTKVTGTPAGTAIDAGSIVKLSFSVTSIRVAAGEADAAAEGDSTDAPVEQAAMRSEAAGTRARRERRIGSSFQLVRQDVGRRPDEPRHRPLRRVAVGSAAG